VAVIMGPLSERHVEHLFVSSMEQMVRSVEQGPSLAYRRDLL
jgi:hypothetical protein